MATRPEVAVGCTRCRAPEVRLPDSAPPTQPCSIGSSVSPSSSPAMVRCCRCRTPSRSQRSTGSWELQWQRHASNVRATPSSRCGRTGDGHAISRRGTCQSNCSSPGTSRLRTSSALDASRPRRRGAQAGTRVEDDRSRVAPRSYPERIQGPSSTSEQGPGRPLSQRPRAAVARHIPVSGGSGRDKPSANAAVRRRSSQVRPSPD